MKLFRSFLTIFSVMFAFSGASAMEGKTQHSPDYISQLPKDMLNVILNLVIESNKDSTQSESKLFESINNLRLVNKQFNSLIQEYIKKQKDAAPEKYKNLNPIQAYKQFQLDLIENLIMENVKTSKYTSNKKNPTLEDIAKQARILKAFRWMKETPLLKEQRALFAKRGDQWRSDNAADQIAASFQPLKSEIEDTIKELNVIWPSSESFINFFDKLSDPKNRSSLDYQRKLKTLITEYKLISELTHLGDLESLKNSLKKQLKLV